MSQKIQYHWQLDVYKLSVEAAMEIYELSKSFPKEETYSLTDQIRRSSRLVSGQIAEAGDGGKTGKRENGRMRRGENGKTRIRSLRFRAFSRFHVFMYIMVSYTWRTKDGAFVAVSAGPFSGYA